MSLTKLTELYESAAALLERKRISKADKLELNSKTAAIKEMLDTKTAIKDFLKAKRKEIVIKNPTFSNLDLRRFLAYEGVANLFGHAEVVECYPIKNSKYKTAHMNYMRFSLETMTNAVINDPTCLEKHKNVPDNCKIKLVNGKGDPVAHLVGYVWVDCEKSQEDMDKDRLAASLNIIFPKVAKLLNNTI